MEQTKTKIINNVFVKKQTLIMVTILISSIVLIMYLKFYYNIDLAYDRVENLPKIAEIPKLQELPRLQEVLKLEELQEKPNLRNFLTELSDETKEDLLGLGLFLGAVVIFVVVCTIGGVIVDEWNP